MRTERVVSRFVTNGSGHYCRVNHTAMDKYTQSVDRSDWIPEDGATFVAESIQADFQDLVDIFDHQLAGLSDTDGPMRSHVAEARSAAERGLQLSHKLIEVLRAPS
jgi:hypothetical protein